MRRPTTPFSDRSHSMHYNRIAREARTLFAALVTASAVAALLCSSAQAQAKPVASAPPAPQRTFIKPADAELKKKLSPLQYAVTQHAATETPYRNIYWDNHE